MGVAPEARAEGTEKWHGPFGGTFNANVTVMSDYSQSGISNTALQPAFQLGLDYRTPNLTSALPLWLYLTGMGVNVALPTGRSLEVDVAAGVKFKPTEKWRIDLGYIRETYPGTPAELGYDHGDFHFAMDYDFGLANLNARLRYSPNAFANSGATINKRGMLTVPLPFMPFADTVSFSGYGSLGNIWVDRYQAVGLPRNDYWYWQFGLVTSSAAYGLDLTIAYTDTNISAEDCGYSGICAGRLFVSLTKRF